MVPVLDVNSEMGAHVKSNIFLFDLIKAFVYFERRHKLDLFSPKRSIFLYAFATCSELPSNISNMIMNISFKYMISSEY